MDYMSRFANIAAHDPACPGKTCPAGEGRLPADGRVNFCSACAAGGGGLADVSAEQAPDGEGHGDGQAAQGQLAQA